MHLTINCCSVLKFIHAIKLKMTFSDLSEFCRLCLLPLNGPYIDCALGDHLELRDTIKMVYNIDVSRNIRFFFLYFFFSILFVFCLFVKIDLSRFKRWTSIQRRCVSCVVTFCCATQFILCVPLKLKRAYHVFNVSRTNYAISARRKPTKRNRNSLRSMSPFSMMLKWLKSNQIVRGIWVQIFRIFLFVFSFALKVDHGLNLTYFLFIFWHMNSE